MRIVHLVQGLAVGGMENCVLRLAKHMHNRAFDVRLVLFDSPFTGDHRECDPGPLRTHFVPRRPGLDLAFSGRLAKLLRAWSPSILHVHDDTALFYAAVALQLIPNDRPSLIVTFHSRPQSTTWKNRVLVRWASRAARSRIAVSGELQQWLTGNGWVRDVELIWNGVSTTRFLPAGTSLGLRSIYGLSPATLLIGIVARFSNGKRQEDLIDAFRIIRARRDDVALILVGDGPTRPAAMDSAADMSHVFFMAESEDIPSILRELDVFVLCSDHEGAPLALLEAMSCGLPVVATAVGGIPDMLALCDAFRWVLVPPRSAACLATAILRLLASQELREELGTKLRSRVLEAFAEERQLSACEAAYNALLREPRS